MELGEALLEAAGNKAANTPLRGLLKLKSLIGQGAEVNYVVSR